MLTSLSPAYCGDQSYELQESKDYIMLTICGPCSTVPSIWQDSKNIYWIYVSICLHKHYTVAVPVFESNP